MSSWQIMEWDLANPLKEAIKLVDARGTFNTIDVENGNRQGTIPLKTLGQLVEKQLPSQTPLRANRADAKFLWLDVRVTFEDEKDKPDDDFLNQISADPLLHQRLFDTVQAEFIQACKDIAVMMKACDVKPRAPSMARGPGPLLQVSSEHKILAEKIGSRLSLARGKGIENLLNILKETLPRELAGKRTRADKIKARVMIGLGVTGLACGIFGIVVAIAATGGTAVPVLAGLGIYASGRGFFDTLKSLSDEIIGVERLGKRINEALAAFQQSKRLNGAKRTAEALANSVVKSGAIGFNLLGLPRFASLSDLNESIKLYEEKLCTVRAKAHELSRQVGTILGSMDSAGKAASIKERLDPHKARHEQDRMEHELHELLTKIPQLHTRCNDNLAKLPELKAAIQQVILSKGKNFILLEKWLDFSINVTLTGLGSMDTVSGVISGAKTARDVASSVTGFASTAIDVKAEFDQAKSNASSRFEKG